MGSRGAVAAWKTTCLAHRRSQVQSSTSTEKNLLLGPWKATASFDRTMVCCANILNNESKRRIEWLPNPNCICDHSTLRVVACSHTDLNMRLEHGHARKSITEYAHPSSSILDFGMAESSLVESSNTTHHNWEPQQH